MDARSASRMASIPSLQHAQGFGPSHFSNHNPSRLKPHAGAQTIEHRDAPDRQECDRIPDVTLQFRRVFDYQHAIAWIYESELVQHGIDKCRFARPCGTSDQNIFPLLDSDANHLNVALAAH